LIFGAYNNGYELSLTAGNVLIFTGSLPDADPGYPIQEYKLPPESYANGVLLLTWQIKGVLYPVSVSEIWIVLQ
jgi:hypothetical protein